MLGLVERHVAVGLGRPFLGALASATMVIAPP
jgi:hypothetical protein